MATKSKRSAAAKTAAAPVEPGAATAAQPEWIAVAAYYRAERRGFEAGHELDDWLQAEQEIHALPARSDQ